MGAPEQDGLQYPKGALRWAVSLPPCPPSPGEIRGWVSQLTDPVAGSGAPGLMASAGSSPDE